MTNPLSPKVNQFALLSTDDVTALSRIAGQPIRSVAACYTMLQEGARPHTVKLVLGGRACRYRVAEDGCRQIITVFVPSNLAVSCSTTSEWVAIVTATGRAP